MLDHETENKFKEVITMLAGQFGGEPDVQAVLFLIGVQELGKGNIKLNKNEKMDVMHIAICTLLAPYGYYLFEGYDADGWPHWTINEKLPPLRPVQQGVLMKQAIVEYFKGEGLIK